MMVDTTYGMQISEASVESYLDSLVNKFFKILPMREEFEQSLYGYLLSLQRELTGFGAMVNEIGNDSIYISILAILQFFVDNACDKGFPFSDVRSEVFHAISLCNKLKSRYKESGDAK